MSKTPTQKPNCYACRYRGSVPGNAHICCLHPEVRALHNNPANQLFAILASVGRCPAPDVGGAIAKLDITANPHGIARGWFIWPFCFDPVWLLTCNGFEGKEGGP